ncbi:hypothetical protein DP113_14490 [Brasilonema octagenarum UFV-E1]|uniref:Uncharacterized protein n=1 Tax=Brasilonema sennae CENA114 TaxID=415709 RepID=A0A856MII5_9CYAN|nr:hypothetical protein [Brasilonema sennae]QDL08957.1 hypothetical protein DP114_14560 [Brasilonema sennae CENA114]QDL15312.1 hypothetical protein DP113_14490 [Brasilonema octagenarum UFV-E1]
MTVSEMELNATSLQQISQSQQIPEDTICETEASQYMIDCYPYAMRGFLWGLFFSIVFLVSAINVLKLVF